MEKLRTGDSSGKSEIYGEKYLAQISAAYGLPNLRFIASPQSGLITDNAILEDEAGNKYFAKKYDVHNDEKLAAIYRAAEITAQNQAIPAILPLIPEDGSYSVELDGTSFALFPYVEHQDNIPDDFEQMNTLLFNTAQTLGRIHSSNMSESEPLLKPIERWLPEARQTRINVLHRILKEIESKGNDRDEFDGFAKEVASEKLAYLEASEEPPAVDIEYSICHADFHGQNVLHDADMNIVAVCDWDNAGLANPYLDFLNTFYNNVVSAKFDTEDQQAVLARSFIEGYEDGLGNTIDIDVLTRTYEAFVQERIGTTWPMYQHYFENDTRNDERLMRVAKQAEKLFHEKERIWNLIKSAAQARD